MSGNEHEVLDITIRELIDIHGEEAVRRGLSYMESLSEAEQNFKEAAGESSGYAEETAKGVNMEDEMDPETREEINNRWAEGMKDGGLGLDDE